VAEALRLTSQWTQDFNATEVATPVLDEAQTRLYIALHDGRVRCRMNGAFVWTWQAGSAVLAAPLIDGETLYVAAGDGVLTALNRITGAVRWQLDVKEELLTTPVLTDGRLFLMSSEESVTAVDAATGKSLWRYHRDRPASFTLRGETRPAISHGLLFAGFADGTVAALRPEDGVARWTRNISGVGDYLDVDAIAAPADDSRIYAASAKAGVLALDALTGATVWEHEFHGANHLVVDGPRIYATGSGAVIGLSRARGVELWRAKLGKDAFADQPVAVDGLLLFAEDHGALIALDVATGRARSAFNTGDGFSQAPFAISGAAFVISNDGTLFSLGLLP
jgi:outer membrane protein assembly factor BamB